MLSDSARNLLLRMLAYNPRHRCTIVDVLQDPWMMAPSTSISAEELPGVVESLRDYCGGVQDLARCYYPNSKISNC
jgi:serine/threonine protein kinase